MTTVLPRPVDVWLRSAPGTGSVAQFPIEQSSGSEYVLGSLTHQKPLLGMFYGAYYPQNFAALLPLLAGFPNEESIRILRQRQVSYVVVDAGQYPSWTADQIAAPWPGLALQHKIGQYLVYRLDGP
jgi:hypothetical protein